FGAIQLESHRFSIDERKCSGRTYVRKLDAGICEARGGPQFAVEVDDPCARRLFRLFDCVRARGQPDGLSIAHRPRLAIDDGTARPRYADLVRRLDGEFRAGY